MTNSTTASSSTAPSASLACDLSAALTYDDADAAIAFLRTALGFQELLVHRDDSGIVDHAELAFGTNVVQLSTRTPSRERSPFDLGPVCLYLVTDDPDRLHSQALAAGADEVLPPTDQSYGSRDAAVRDAEGHVWCYGTYRPGASVA
jgi:uncharacterized glyoxalase superfamily protein PhnB